MLWKTHIRICNWICEDLGLPPGPSKIIKDSVIVPDKWKDYPHHHGKGRTIRKYVLEARKAFLTNDYQKLASYIIKLTTQATFYEGVGVLVEEGLIDINLVDKLLRNNILGNWESLEPLIHEMRQIGKQRYDALASYDKYHVIYDTWERLYNRIKQLPAHSTA